MLSSINRQENIEKNGTKHFSEMHSERTRGHKLGEKIKLKFIDLLTVRQFKLCWPDRLSNFDPWVYYEIICSGDCWFSR